VFGDQWRHRYRRRASSNSPKSAAATSTGLPRLPIAGRHLIKVAAVGRKTRSSVDQSASISGIARQITRPSAFSGTAATPALTELAVLGEIGIANEFYFQALAMPFDLLAL